MNGSDSKVANRFFGTISILIIIGVVADLAGFVFYIKYLRSIGIGWADPVGWSQQLSYLKTPLGAILTFLGIAPYVIVFLWVWLHKPPSSSNSDD